MIKVAFLGTPEIGAAALESLINNDKIEVVVAVTTIDKAIGRSHSELKPTPVAILAEENGIDVIKTESINKDIDKLKEYEYDYMLTCAFGQFLSDDVLATPKKLPLNIHGSLLPDGRGGAPLHWAIINGKKETGISIMEMVSKMDAGDYYSQYKIEINEDDTVDDLFVNMSNLIRKKSAQGIIDIEQGATPNKQDEDKVTFWMNIKKEDSKVDFSKKSTDVYNQIRGLTSKPGAWALLDGKILKINSSMKSDVVNEGSQVGEIFEVNNDGAYVNCGNNTTLILKEVTIEGQKRKSITSNEKDALIGKILN